MTLGQRMMFAAACLTPFALAACQGSGASFASHKGSPSGIPITVESIDGPPTAVKTALAGELAAAATERQVELAGTGTPARFRLRGYLTTETSADGETALAFVWDVFDAEGRRATRLAGTSPAGTSRRKPWPDLDKATLARLAAQSMDEIAGFLSEPIVVADASSGTGAALGFTTP